MKNSIIAQFKQTRHLLKIARAIQEMSKPLEILHAAQEG